MSESAVVKLCTSSTVHSSSGPTLFWQRRAPLWMVNERNSISLSGNLISAERSFSSSDKRPRRRITISWRRNLQLKKISLQKRTSNSFVNTLEANTTFSVDDFIERVYKIQMLEVFGKFWKDLVIVKMYSMVYPRFWDSVNQLFKKTFLVGPVLHPSTSAWVYLLEHFTLFSL